MASASTKYGFPTGAFFAPTDRQLINSYLMPKVLDDVPLFDVVKDVQVYGQDSNPWQVFDLDDGDSWFDCADKETERIRLVFTKLSKLSAPNSKKKNKGTRTRENTSKKAGCGTWVAKSKPEHIDDGHGNVIGERRYLVFDIKDTDLAAVVGHRFGSFRMHEYCLSGINERFDPSRTHVLCKITHESSKLSVCPEIPALDTNSNISVCPEIPALDTSSSVVDHDPVIVQGINEFVGDLCFSDQGGEFPVYYDLCLDDTLCLDEDLVSELLNSMSEEGGFVPDTPANLGKRKFEEESFCGTKKLCM